MADSSGVLFFEYRKKRSFVDEPKTGLGSMLSHVAFVFLLASCASSPKVGTWEYAQYHDTTYSYESYVKRSPNGPHLAEARRLQDLRAFQTWSAEEYIKKFPEGNHFEAARLNYEPVLWEKVSSEPTLFRLQHYLEWYPNGLYVAEANEALTDYAIVDVVINDVTYGPKNLSFDLELVETNGVGLWLRKHSVSIPSGLARSNFTQLARSIRLEPYGRETFQNSLRAFSDKHGGLTVYFIFEGKDDNGHPVFLSVPARVPEYQTETN